MGNGILRYIKIYRILLMQDIKGKMHFSVDFLISILGIIITNFSGALSLWIIFDKVNMLNGWSYYEMLYFYGFSILSIAPSSLFFDNVWNISRMVHTGDFIKYCFRPVNILFYYISEVFNITALSDVIFGSVILIYSIYHLNLKITFLGIISFILILICSSLIMSGILILASATAFWIYNCHSVLIFVNKFKDFSRYPVTIFRGFFKVFISFIIPIAYISYYPSLLFLDGFFSSSLALLTPIVGIIFFLVSCKVWLIGAYSYEGTGN